MKKLFVIILISLFLFGIFFETANAYVSVKGYWRGSTYVKPYIRSSPNALKFDNYSWTSTQGLFNNSYYAPTKNYSSNWYTPSWVTDQNYYTGKALYKSSWSW
jgi:hypothetical protein